LVAVPEQAVMHQDQGAVTGFPDHLVDGPLRCIDGGDNAGDLAVVLHLQSVEGTIVVGHLADAKVLIEIFDQFEQRHRLHCTPRPVTCSVPAAIESAAAFTRCSRSVANLSRSAGLSSNLITPLANPNDSTLGAKPSPATSRATSSIARGRSITADAGTRPGASED